MFVDTPLSVGPEVATAIALADIVLVPCKPSPDDLWAEPLRPLLWRKSR